MAKIIWEIVFILIILFTHLLVLSTQSISSKDYFYGVYIRLIELDDNFKNRVDKEFKSSLNKGIILIILIYFMSNFLYITNTAINILVVIFLYLFLAYINLKKAYIKVKEYKNKYIKEYNIEISKKDNKENSIYINEDLDLIQHRVVNKFKILFRICIGLSLLSFLYTAINYNSMPNTIITHWGAYGKPDGFSPKSIKNVFSTNFIDLSTVIFLSYIFIESIKSRIYIDKNNMDENIKKAKKYLNGMGYSFLLLILSMQSIMTTIPIFMVNEKNIPMYLIIGVCIVPIFITVAIIYFYMMLSSLKPKDKSISYIESDDEKWLYGFIYYNKEDPQFLVEKRLGAGWNMNMANPKAKIFMLLIVILLIVSLVLPFI